MASMADAESKSAAAAAAAGDSNSYPFITINPDTNQFEIHPEAVAVLDRLKCPVAVVSVAGMYRTGKSYLLNLLKSPPGSDPEPAAEGFSVGHSVNAHTKGIWLWGEPVRIDDQDVAVVFLDTEGLGSMGASQTHDCRIFALALLIGSYFIYNSRGVIDGNAIENLSLVVNLTKHIHVGQALAGDEDSGADFGSHFPAFMWVVRDFTLQLKSATGRPIPPKTYLEKALKPENESDEDSVKKNQVRAMLSAFFPDRDCVPLVRPVSDEAALKTLSSCAWDGLRDEFRSGVTTLRKKLYGKVRPKEMYGKLVTGPMLVNLARSYVDAINAGGVPTISSAWDRVVEAQCSDAADAAFLAYQTGMRAAQSARDAPASAVRNGVRVLEHDALYSAHVAALAEAERVYETETVQTVSEASVKASRTYKANLREDTRRAWDRVAAANARASKDLCGDLIKRLDRAREDGDRARRKAAGGGGAGGGAALSSRGRTASFEGQLAELRRLQAERDKVRAKLSKAAADKAGSADGASGAGAAAAQKQKDEAALLDVGKQLERFKKGVDEVVRGYEAEAVGPAKAGVLQEYLLGTVMPSVVRTGVEGARQQQAKIKELKEQLLTKANDVTSALTKANEVRSQMTDKISGLKKGMQEQLAAADLDKRNTVAMYEAKLSESKAREGHLTEMQEAMRATAARLETDLSAAREAGQQSSSHEREWLERERSWHADERRLREQASKATFELEALQRERTAAQAVTERETQRRLQDLRDRHRAEVDRLNREHETSMVEQESRLKTNNAGASTAETTSLRNQLRDAQSSVDTLNQHVDLLTETLGVTKDLLAAKTQEVGECEYQWAAAKAKLAQCESDKMEHEADVVHVLEPIVSQIKRLVRFCTQ